MAGSRFRVDSPVFSEMLDIVITPDGAPDKEMFDLGFNFAFFRLQHSIGFFRLRIFPIGFVYVDVLLDWLLELPLGATAILSFATASTPILRLRGRLRTFVVRILLCVNSDKLIIEA